MNNKNLFSHRNKEPERGVLYVVGTPIGNLSDISPRALNILKNVSIIACEDTRNTKKILFKFGIKNKLLSFHKYNSSKNIPSILISLKNGNSIALVSDAGMPGICDPGEDLIREAKSQKLDVICIPGPCAGITALISSGMSSSKFVFEGFLPKKKTDREKILLEISKNERTTILYESPHRLSKLLQELQDFCGGSREIHISRELTKKFEEHINTDISNAINFFSENPIIGEFTIIVKGVNIKDKQIDEENIKKDLHDLLNSGISLSCAAKYLAKKEKVTKNFIYNLHKSGKLLQ